MATSGSIDFNETLNEIIKDALIDAEIIGLEDTVDDATNAYAKRKLNKMVKHLQSVSERLWNRKEAVLFLAKNTQSYNVSSASSSWHITNSYVSTTASTAASSGASTVTLTSVSGMSASDYIGVELDDGTRQWTTISSINTGTKVVTLATTLSAAAASGNTVVTYTSKINRPLKVLAARRYNLSDDVYIPLELIRYEDYKDLSKKSTAAYPTQVAYDKQLTTGVMYVYPVANSVKDLIYFTYEDPIEDFDSATDNADFPQEWLMCLTAGLAYYMALKFEKPTAERFKAEYTELLDQVSGFDTEDAPLTICPQYK